MERKSLRILFLVDRATKRKLAWIASEKVRRAAMKSDTRGDSARVLRELIHAEYERMGGSEQNT